TTLDGPNVGGTDGAITVGTDGLGLIAYPGPYGGGVKVAHCSNPACTSATVSLVVPASESSGFYPSVAIGSDGLPLLAYTAAPHGLGVAHCADVLCSSATTAQIVPLPDSPAAPWIAIGNDGRAIITYRETSAPLLRIAHCHDTPCTSARTGPVSPNAHFFSAVVVGRDGIPLVLSGTPAGRLETWRQTTRCDLGVDGRPDLAWRRDGTGENLVWLMNGANLLSASFTNPPALADTRWRLAGTSDFNHDAQTVLLWRHSSS